MFCFVCAGNLLQQERTFKIVNPLICFVFIFEVCFSSLFTILEFLNAFRLHETGYLKISTIDIGIRIAVYTSCSVRNEMEFVSAQHHMEDHVSFGYRVKHL